MQVYIQNYDPRDASTTALGLPELFPRPLPVDKEPAPVGVPVGMFPPAANNGDALPLPELPSAAERLVANRLTTNGVTIRKLEGRDHYVVPVTLIAGDADGLVMRGSGGAIHYPAAETAKTAHLWNGRPIVRDHPGLHGVSTANDPEAFSRQRVGTIFNARIENSRLVAEAWIDVARVHSIDRRIASAIVKRQAMEVSTGVYVVRVQGTGVVNGRQYEGVATDYRPDHLAILPDSVGACSIKDGCGLLRNSATDQPARDYSPGVGARSVPRTEPLGLPSLD